ncbi:MAG: YggW family oxidoreductase [Comamonas sp. SCN 65-56]|uniref:radical SAM family heme chaperone HemW n=1 Tax=Comamonas sp. SCN 65-56 TaxID=1660095 RepID=UPI00086A17C7|nr:radical SAM family heme chaperone HemW [Comamonas sp. SCN 65-56]ODS92948.1 MAG: YggW family oxidoreductase [Comamonas sp. SCN 65-56]
MNHDTTALQDVQRYIGPGPLRLPSLPPLSLYVHIPWCLKKCPYCDFNSHALKHGEGAPEARYIAALTADLEAVLPLVWGRTVSSIFIGGGTPSLFSPEAIDRLIAMIRARLMLEAGCEITLEANPGTFEKDRFRAFRAAGVTRLSIGVQSFNDAHLKAIGRVHDAAQARAAAEEVASNFETFNLDLMYALPGQSLTQLEEDLRTALGFKPPHLSIYHLTIEPNTLFAKYPPRLPDGDVAYAMLDRITALTQAAGLARYEVSAFAQAAHRCTHNTNYWQFGDYIGIGAGAHGKLSFAHRVMRQVRYRDPKQYMEHALSGNAIAQEHEVSKQDLAFEFMLNALRLKDGFLVRDFCTRTGQPVTAITQGLKAAEARGLLKTNLVHIQPTERGFDFLSDLQELFLPG